MGRRARLSLAFALAAFGCAEGEPPAKGPGAAAVQVEIVDLKGVEAALARREGRAFLLNVWAMWCQPCVAELPELMEVAREYRKHGGEVLGISYDLMVPGADRARIVAEVRGFLAARKLELPTLIYDASDFDAIDERLDMPGGVPVTLAFDKRGQVVDQHAGQATKARFEEMMKKALGL